MPVALLVMALVSTFALLAYRNTLQLLIEERVAEAERLGRQLSGELSLGRLREIDRLRHRLPQASRISVVDERGRLVAGDIANEGTGDGASTSSFPWWGPVGSSNSVVGTTAFKVDGQAYAVRVELPAHILRSREQGLRLLTPLILAITGGITVIVLLFLRRFLLPFDRMVEHARRVGQQAEGSQDEVGFLVDTFEKALTALAESGKAESYESIEGTLVRSLESGVLLCDAAGVVLGLNDVGARLLGVPMPSMGCPLSEALASRPGMLEVVERVIRHGETVQRQECAVPTEDGGVRTLGVTVHALRRESKEVRGFLTIFADLTEVQKKQREKWLADSLAQLGELTAGAAHELRNSLATLRGYLSLIERDPQGKMLPEYLAEVRHESDHLKRVLEDFLTFARPGSLRPKEVDLMGLAHRAAADPGLGGAAVEVVAPSPDVDSDDWVVQGDPQLLERAVRNLLSNAVEAQREVSCEAPVIVRLGLRGGGVELEIEDRGPGLPANPERMFDPFFSQRSGGVGMGLALTRRIALLHMGHVEIEGRETGGVRAVLWLPAGKSVTKGIDAS